MQRETPRDGLNTEEEKNSVKRERLLDRSLKEKSGTFDRVRASKMWVGDKKHQKNLSARCKRARKKKEERENPVP